MSEHLIHPVSPLFDATCDRLILGTFPSVKSREGRFFYNHPQNRFWNVMAALFEEPLPTSPAEKSAMMLRNHVALWDVVYSCTVTGSSDSSIRNVVPTDLSIVLKEAPIRRMFANGDTAYRLYMRYSFETANFPITKLPSTSPANASWSFDRLLSAWQEILLP